MSLRLLALSERFPDPILVRFRQKSGRAERIAEVRLMTRRRHLPRYVAGHAGIALAVRYGTRVSRRQFSVKEE